MTSLRDATSAWLLVAVTLPALGAFGCRPSTPNARPVAQNPEPSTPDADPAKPRADQPDPSSASDSAERTELLDPTDPTDSARESSTSEPAADGTTQHVDPEGTSLVEAAAEPEDAVEPGGSGSDSEVQVAQPAAGERFLLLPAGGPILVEVQLFIANRPVGAAFEQLVAHALDVADANQDGTVSWDELTESSVFQYGQLGNAPIDNESERLQMIRMYDLNRNQKVDPEEVPRLLTRNAGGSRPFSFKSSNYYREANRLDSAVRRRLDRNVDGWIDEDELASASLQLRTRDGDGNDILGPEDFRLASEDEPQPLAQRRTSDPDGAIQLTERMDARYVLYTLSELYAFGADLTVSDMPRSAEWFGALDVDEDGTISLDEIEGLKTLPPQIRLRVDFDLATQPGEGGEAGEDELAEETGSGEPDEDDPAEPLTASADPTRLQLVALSPELESDAEVLAQTSTGFVLRWPDLQLAFFANDMADRMNRRGQVSTILADLDANANGYLEKDEVADDALGSDFDQIDTNQDEKLFPDELERYLVGQRSAVQSQIHCRAGFDSDALFLALDTSGDRRLTSRELDGASARLSGLDQNADGLVSVREIPDAMVIGFARGDSERGNALFAGPAYLQPTSELDKPAWFEGMDINQDGDVSRKEFLGTAEQFERIDINQDGYLDTVESSSTESAQ